MLLQLVNAYAVDRAGATLLWTMALQLFIARRSGELQRTEGLLPQWMLLGSNRDAGSGRLLDLGADIPDAAVVQAILCVAEEFSVA